MKEDFVDGAQVSIVLGNAELVSDLEAVRVFEGMAGFYDSSRVAGSPDDADAGECRRRAVDFDFAERSRFEL
jgi:hypothetical protein